METTLASREDELHFLNQAYRNLVHLEHMYRTNKLQDSENLEQIRVCLHLIEEQILEVLKNKVESL